ncbi:MAG: enoyl-CoA hydratase-related protein, partial [Vicingaceae bacterium]
VVAHERVNFIQAFSGIGLIPDSGGTFFLPRLIGFQKASALAMLGDKVGAAEAERMGMIYKVLPFETFSEEVDALANRMAKMPTKGLALTKFALNKALTNDLTAQLQVESDLQIEASETKDYREGVAAFLEKRKPNFIGE